VHFEKRDLNKEKKVKKATAGKYSWQKNIEPVNLETFQG